MLLSTVPLEGSWDLRAYDLSHASRVEGGEKVPEFLDTETVKEPNATKEAMR